MATLQEKHIKTLDQVLGREISGMFNLRTELQEFMPNDEISALLKRTDHLYQKGIKQNNGRPYNPRYRFNRLIDADTVHPQIVFQVLMPGNHHHTASVIGEVVLDLDLADHGTVTFLLPAESVAKKLARESGWKASDEELKALDELIAAAKKLQGFGNKNFPVEVQVDSNGVAVSAHYNDPLKAARLALIAG